MSPSDSRGKFNHFLSKISALHGRAFNLDKFFGLITIISVIINSDYSMIILL